MFADGSLCLFEAKTATRHKKEDWEAGIPIYYMPQPSQYMEVLDDPRISGGYIGCCFGAGKYDWVMHRYERDWLLGKKQIEATARFWQDYIAAGVLPPLSGNAELDMAVVYGYDNAPQIATPLSSAALPASCEALMTEYRQLIATKKALTKSVNTAKAIENDYKDLIIRQVPEGLTLIQQPNELTYRVSLTVANLERVDVEAFRTANPYAALAVDKFDLALSESELLYTKPTVNFTTPPKRKGA